MASTLQRLTGRNWNETWKHFATVDFLVDSTEVTTYSTYVTTAVTAYENGVSNGYPTNSPPCIGIDLDNFPVLFSFPELTEQ